MTPMLDAELLAAMAARGSGPAATVARNERGDWRIRRTQGNESLAVLEARLSECSSVSREDYEAVSYDGARILVRWFTPESWSLATGGPAVVYLHGGGMISGSVHLFDRLVAGYVHDSGVAMLSVDYRLAPEHPHPAPVEDCFAGLAWLHENSPSLGVDPARIAVMGDSAGGGLAAATAVVAAERLLPLAKQILVYPMLDDRTTGIEHDPSPFLWWSRDDNYTGWHALLGSGVGQPTVPATAAPARGEDLSSLPSAYVEVGDLDLFRDESIEYARRLAAAGVSTELHVHPGCPHGFDRVDPAADVVMRSRADRLRMLRGL